MNNIPSEPTVAPLRRCEKTLSRALLILAITFTSVNAEKHKKQHRTSDAPFLKPAEAVAKMEIPEGFDVSIFAAEPDIGEPIAFTFDGRGRIWVVENYNYINRRSHKENVPLSRIQIFEDTDSDGVFDTKKLFTDKITFSSGIAIGFGGVYLGSPPNLLFIPDANADDVPDGEPRILLDGWGTHDRHETLNSFIWGPDGWLYGCHGVFTRSNVGKPGAPAEERQFIDAGIWRFHPVSEKFEIFARGLSNPWGFDFNDVGHGFATCCVIPHLFHVVQGGVYHKQSKPHVNPYIYDDIKTIRDHTHLSAHGGARFYLADTFPEAYQNQLFMCNIHEHTVLTDYMVPNKSSYIGKHGFDFMPTNDLAWVGFSVEIGPDGGVYILDWHDTDVCGNAINFPNSGRIYRIFPKDAPKIERPNIPSLTDLELVKLQEHPNDWYVRQARVELHSRKAAGKLNTAEVHRALDAYLPKAPTTGKRLRTLWAMHVTGFFEGNQSRLIGMLANNDEHWRSWAVQLLCENGSPGKEALEAFAALAINEHRPMVRMYLASALQRLPFEERWPILQALAYQSEDIDDPLIPRLLWYALEPMVTEHPDKALEVATNGRIPFLQACVARRMVSGALPIKGQPNPAERRKWRKIIHEMAPGFTINNVGEGGVRKLTSFRNETAVQTHPLDKKVPCTLTRKLQVPKDKTTTLKIRGSYHPHGDWQLRVLADKQVLADQIVSYKSIQKEWFNLDVDLSTFGGKTITLSVENRANDWMNEFGYWGSVKVESK